MLNSHDILETINMIDNENLDVRTITMGISLLDCIDSDADRACDKIYDKICRYAQNLVKTGEDISKEYGIPIIHKRISVTPIAMVAGANPGAGPGALCPCSGQGRPHCWRQLYRRLFRFGPQRLWPRGLRPH